MKKFLLNLKNGNSRCRVLGAAFLLVLSAAVWHGMQAVYRPLVIPLVLFAALAFFVKKHWWEFTFVPAAAYAAFLSRFRPTGYKYMALAVLGVAVLLTVLRFGGKKLRRGVGILTLAGVLALTALEIPIVKNARTDSDPGRDYLIVLGAAVYGETPSVSLENRLKAALSYLETYPDAKAVLSGGAGTGEDISEAECMYRYLTEHGIGAERLIREENSFSTYENLSNSRALIEADGGSLKSVALISNTYHLCRAKKIAGSLGMEAAGVAGQPGLPLYMCGMFLREAVGIVHFYLFGN